ncbi:MAG: hypothetical protein C1942_09050 [Prosthecochloris sp.]|nr:hypothetical protein [Prosthecochloris sp.]
MMLPVRYGSLNSGRYSLFVIRYSLFVIRYSLFVIRYSLFVIRKMKIFSCLSFSYTQFVKIRRQPSPSSSHLASCLLSLASPPVAQRQPFTNHPSLHSPTKSVFLKVLKKSYILDFYFSKFINLSGYCIATYYQERQRD